MPTTTKREIAQSLEFLGVASGKLTLQDCKHLGKLPARRKQTEAGEQAALFDWVRLMEARHPELRLLHHIPNGGRRDTVEAARLKAQGVRAGVPDLCLPVARSGYHGLYIELKAPGGRTQDTQRRWLDELTAQGYRAVVCYGFDEARMEIEGYLMGCGV